ncbi:esterase/lipase family protein, partial [Candidatus Riflebacteria bacterium]
MEKTWEDYKNLFPENTTLNSWELEYHKSGGGPVVILIHGHGTSKRSFTDPLDEFMGDSIPVNTEGSGKKARNRLLHFDFLLTEKKPPDSIYYPFGPGNSFCLNTPLRLSPAANNIRGIWKTLVEQNFNVLTWSQIYNNRSIEDVYKELVEIVESVIPFIFQLEKVIFICHSRGGLAARLYIQRNCERNNPVLGLIQLATPNDGSSMASRVDRLAKIGQFGVKIGQDSRKILEKVFGHSMKTIFSQEQLQLY